MRRLARSTSHPSILFLFLVWAGIAMLASSATAATEASRTMLHDYLIDQAGIQFEARRLDVAARKTPEAIRQRQESLRAKFRTALGDLPERSPLNPRVVGTLARDGYRVEKVIYESRPGHHVTASFYIPDGRGPFPGVLVPCGHSANGKAAEPYQRISILLAKNGLAALCFDPIGQGERLQALNDQGKPLFRGRTDEHTGAGLGALLVGRSAAGYRVWDGIRSLDYLASRPEIDPNRLGCTGNSGGGTETAYLMALDDRIAVAAPSCYITSLERLFATIGPQDAEQNITGQVAFGLNHADFVTIRAPKPTLLSVGTQDFFDIQGSWDTFREAKLLYGRFGFGERVDLFESDEPHGFTKPRRESSMRWLRRWLLDKCDAPTEGDFPVSADQELQCTKTGQVLRDEPDEKSVFDLNAERAAELASQRASVRKDDAWLGGVRRLIALRSPFGRGSFEEQWVRILTYPLGAPVPIETLANRRVLPRGLAEVDIRGIQIRTEPGIVVPARLCNPVNLTTRSPLILMIGTGEEAGTLAPNDPAVPHLKAGRRVLVADLRGLGETGPAASPGASAAFGDDVKDAFLALHLGRPLLGQRVGDLVAILDALGDRLPREGVHVVAFGQTGPIALHAAALDRRITQVTVEGAPASWDDVARRPVIRYPLAEIVPNALTVYDLPDLAAAIAPRPLTIRAAVDPESRLLASDRLETLYAAARAAYRNLNAADALVIQPGDSK
jgi:cephalosporin-C deacetylase-like acetyl esterase